MGPKYRTRRVRRAIGFVQTGLSVSSLQTARPEGKYKISGHFTGKATPPFRGSGFSSTDYFRLGGRSPEHGRLGFFCLDWSMSASAMIMRSSKATNR